MAHNKTQSKALAGYSPHTSPTDIERAYTGRLAKMDIETQRAELAKIPGLTLADGALFLTKVRDNRKSATSDRLNANKQLTTLLGMAPKQQIEITERHQITGALAVLHKLIVPDGGKMGLNPAVLCHSDATIPDLNGEVAQTGSNE